LKQGANTSQSALLVYAGFVLRSGVESTRDTSECPAHAPVIHEAC